MADLKEFLEKRVRVISTDARLFEGILQGYDKSTNLIISECIERIVYDDEEDEENQEIALGLYLMRGGTVVCVGEIDEEKARDVDWQGVKGQLKGTKNPL